MTLFTGSYIVLLLFFFADAVAREFLHFFTVDAVVFPALQAMSSMNLVQMSQLMDKFQKQFDDLDVQAAVMEDAMGSSVTTTMPEGQVESLMSEVADEHGYVDDPGISRLQRKPAARRTEPP